ncbi:transmembrane protein, putative (macronuclear) [Tetrahymena thermophila SB210]|uniref:Transmembrane protein, putative n=1 Tax=Tetrahymena thermophila (strain SB210) TaxID=312017 RepID=Q22SH2_TETTS|nr:transmembrane protein, putative [Tetrahymena thermophila SB210]EAR87800.3 transmembrane protein, putative [Tetrahymena thermophila SB210]|eukprot:XP_001008045.3 transmembrane protein, putative [Tetrahymena thermophila SB210]
MSKFQKIFNFLKELDIFGTQISLNYNKENSFRTSFGGITTIVCLFLLSLLCFSTVSNLFQKAQVTYVQSVNYSTNPSALEISSDNFMIAVQYDQQNFITRPMINITFEQRLYHRSKDGTVSQKKIPYYLEPCTLEHFINLPSYQFNWTESFYQQNISNFLCLQKNQKFYVGGIYENEDFQFIKFSISKCVNSTANPNSPWNPTCEQPDIIKSKQNQGSRIRFLISNNILNPEKATGSITSFLDSQIFNVQQSQMYTTANVYLNQQTLITDESIFPIESLHTESLIQFQRSDVQQQFSFGNFGVYCEIFFARSNFSTIAKKSYLKLNQVISYIGGFCQVFFIISVFLVNKYNTYIFYNELANRLYDFDTKDDEQNNPQYKMDKKRDTIQNKDVLNSQTRNNTIDQTPVNFKKDNINYLIGSSPLKPIQERNKIIPLQLEKEDKKQNLSFKNYLGQLDNSSGKNNSILNNMFKNNIKKNKSNIKDEDEKPPLNIQEEKNIQKINLNELGEKKDVKEINDLDQQKQSHQKFSTSYLDHEISILNDNKNTAPLIKPSNEDQNEQTININQFQLSELSSRKEQKVQNLELQNAQNNQITEQVSFENQENSLIKTNQLSGPKNIWDNLIKVEQNQLNKENKNYLKLYKNQSHPESQNSNILNQQENQKKITHLNQSENNIFTNNKEINSNKQSLQHLQNKEDIKHSLNQNQEYQQGSQDQNKTQQPNKVDVKKDFQFDNNQLDYKHEYLRQNQKKDMNKYISDNQKNNIKMLTQIRQPNQFLENELKTIIDRDRSLYVTFKYIVNQLTCGKIFNTPDVQLLNKAYDLVSEDLDIFTILDRQLQLNKIKNLIFNEDQQVLFNFFPKPVIKLNKETELLNLKQIKDDEQQQSRNLAKVKRRQRRLNIGFKEHGIFAQAVFKFRKQQDKMTNYQKLYSHYSKLAKHCMDDNYQSSINKKLIEHLGDEMRYIFEVADFMQKKSAKRVSLLNQLNQQKEEYPQNQCQEILQKLNENIQNSVQNKNDIENKVQQNITNQDNNQEIQQEFPILNQQKDENEIQLIVFDDDIDKEIQD